MVQKFRRSWQLVKTSGAIIQDDPSLLLFPFLSVVAAVFVVATFTVPALGSTWLAEAAENGNAWMYVWLFLLYIALYFTTFFFNTALIGVVLRRLEGHAAGIADGLGIAGSRTLRILGYAVLAATVGIVLRALEDRIGWIGRLVIAVLGTAWTVTTFLVVPVLATRDVSPIEAVTESARLLKQTWGETIIGHVGMGATFGLAYILLVVVAGGGAIALAGAGFGIWALVIVLTAVLCGTIMALVQNALQAIYSAALYRHVVGGSVPGFPSELLAGAFASK